MQPIPINNVRIAARCPFVVLGCFSPFLAILGYDICPRRCVISGPEVEYAGYYAHSRDNPLILSILPHGFMVGVKKSF